MKKAVVCLSILALCQIVSAYPSSNSYFVHPKLTLLTDSDDEGIYFYTDDGLSDELESPEPFYSNDRNQDLYSNVLRELEDAPSAPHRRLRRQLDIRTPAMHLAGDHSRPVGQIHGIFRPSGGGTLPNYNIGATAGLGSTIWRSPNRQHSLGLGATVDHSRGSFGGISSQTPFNLNAGIGYKWNFG